ncbi:MAG: response regulator transcription factor [Acholeplasmataceae bacterium]
MKKVLIVENELNLVHMMTQYLENAGYFVMSTPKGSEAEALVNAQTFDVVILDIMLDDLDGWRVCRHIKTTTTAKVIMLTARHDEEDKLFGFDLGAEDYMTKPFSLKELVVRVGKVMSMVNHQEKFQFLKASLEVIVEGNKIQLTKTESDVLDFLIRQKGAAVSRESLLNAVWGYIYEGDTRTVDTTIKRLRKKLLPLTCIHTVFGVGYKFEVES